uniref:Uncharacterized protein n=1 Tax=viral metagenome TaxID=1070528 RepID=A0A6C0KM23_9ZZZZ
MPSSVLQLLFVHMPFRRALCQQLNIQSEDIDDKTVEYDETIENKDSWFSLKVTCKDKRLFKISTRRLPQNTTWEFKQYI